MIKKTLASTMLMLSCTSIIAGGLGGCDDSTEWKKVSTLSGGVAWARSGETQSNYYGLSNVISNTYVADEHTSSMGTGELFFAVQWPFTCYVNTQLGFAFGGSATAKMQGAIYVNDIYSGSDYRYYTNHSKITMRSKWIADPKTMFLQPYVTVAAGVAFNAAFGFETMPYVDPALSPRWFDNKTNVAFTYSAGVGIEKRISQFWSIGVGYEFSDWGKSGFGPGIDYPWVQDGPQLTHMYEQKAIVSVSYIC